MDSNSFSSREIVEDIMRWAAVESPSVTPDAVARMFDLAEADFRACRMAPSSACRPRRARR